MVETIREFPHLRDKTAAWHKEQGQLHTCQLARGEVSHPNPGEGLMAPRIALGVGFPLNGIAPVRAQEEVPDTFLELRSVRERESEVLTAGSALIFDPIEAQMYVVYLEIKIA